MAGLKCLPRHEIIQACRHTFPMKGAEFVTWPPHDIVWGSPRDKLPCSGLFRESKEAADGYTGTAAPWQLPHSAVTPADKVNVRQDTQLYSHS